MLPEPTQKPEQGEVDAADRKPAEVPVFNCIVYVSNQATGAVRARVANLPALEFTAGSQREALSKAVTTFKQQIGELVKEGETIPWIDPPFAPEPGEQTRLIAVHL